MKLSPVLVVLLFLPFALHAGEFVEVPVTIEVDEVTVPPACLAARQAVEDARAHVEQWKAKLDQIAADIEQAKADLLDAETQLAIAEEEYAASPTKQNAKTVAQARQEVHARLSKLNRLMELEQEAREALKVAAMELKQAQAHEQKACGKQPAPGGEASGSLSTARFSDSTVESIGCEVHASGTTSTGFCEAVDAAGNTANCYTDAPEMIVAMRGINEYSYLRFEWNGGGQCTGITTGAGSRYLPDTRDLGLGAPGNSGSRGR